MTREISINESYFTNEVSTLDGSNADGGSSDSGVGDRMNKIILFFKTLQLILISFTFLFFPGCSLSRQVGTIEIPANRT
jgi:hypothetical protein